MKKCVLVTFVLLFASFSLTTSGFASDLIREIRDVDAFHSVKMSGSGTLYITQGNSTGLRVESTKRILKNLETYVAGGTLIIKRKPNLLPLTGTLNVYVDMAAVRELELSGSCKIKGNNTITAETLEIETSGSSDVELSLEAAFLKTKSSGSSDIELRGSTDTLEFKVSGSGDLHAFDLAAKNVSINISGSGQAWVSASNTLIMQISGSGRVLYKGDPRRVTQKISGSGSIEKVE